VKWSGITDEVVICTPVGWDFAVGDYGSLVGLIWTLRHRMQRVLATIVWRRFGRQYAW